MIGRPQVASTPLPSVKASALFLAKPRLPFETGLRFTVVGRSYSWKGGGGGRFVAASGGLTFVGERE